MACVLHSVSTGPESRFHVIGQGILLSQCLSPLTPSVKWVSLNKCWAANPGMD